MLIIILAKLSLYKNIEFFSSTNRVVQVIYQTMNYFSR